VKSKFHPILNGVLQKPVECEQTSPVQGGRKILPGEGIISEKKIAQVHAKMRSKKKKEEEEKGK